MDTSQKPSKQFLIRGGIAVGIVAIMLTAQTNWFRELFNKEPKQPVAAPQTIGDIVGADTNKNGIADWEERLWGLDPTVLYTNGVPNKQIIEEKKQALGVPLTTNTTTTENETDELAQQLLTITAALGQETAISDEDLRAIATKLASSVAFEEDALHYSLKDVRPVQTTTSSLTTYYTAVSAVAARYGNGAPDIDVVITAYENGDPTGLTALKDTQSLYRQYSQALLAIETPIGLQNLHLAMANSVYGLSTALGYLSELPSNGANAFAGIALYKIYDQKLFTSLEAIREYLIRYGILETQ